MAGTLPDLVCCPDPCESPVSVEVPGPPGGAGAPGAAGAAGQSAFTTLSANFTMPAEAASAVAAVVNSSWIAVNEIVYLAKSDGSVIGYFQATAIGGATSVTLKNLKDTANSLYVSNSALGAVFTTGSKLCPSGLQGPVGVFAGTAAGGDLKGTYVNPRISVANTKGSIPAGDGTNTTAFPVGANGDLLSPDSTAGNGLKYFKGLPITGDANVAANRIPRLSAAAGLPIPLEASAAQINAPGSVAAGKIGAVVLDASTGNARGTDAVDLQVVHGVVTEVASGTQSVIAGGKDNTASGTRSAVGGGETNVASGTESVVAGGNANTAAGTHAAVAGGDTNNAATQESFVGGGNSNTAGAGGNIQAAVCGGDHNSATGDESFVGGGNTNGATGANSVVGGGASNGASASYSTVPGGKEALADKYGQVAHSAGAFAVPGDSQVAELIWRILTTDATVNVEMFLDGAGVRAAIAAGSTWTFDILVTGRSSAGVSAGWRVTGAIQNNAGTTALVAAVATTVLADGTGATWGVAGNVVVDADNGNDALRIRVTGAAATNIRWSAHARIMQVMF